MIYLDYMLIIDDHYRDLSYLEGKYVSRLLVVDSFTPLETLKLSLIGSCNGDLLYHLHTMARWLKLFKKDYQSRDMNGLESCFFLLTMQTRELAWKYPLSKAWKDKQGKFYFRGICPPFDHLQPRPKAPPFDINLLSQDARDRLAIVSASLEAQCKAIRKANRDSSV